MKILVEIIVTLFRLLPAGMAVLLGKTIGGILSLFSFRRDVIDRQMQMVFPELTDRQSLVRAHYRHLGLLMVEMLRLPRTTEAQATELMEVHGLQNLHDAMDRKKGALLIIGHCGCWEASGKRIDSLGITIKAVGKEMKSGAGEILRVMVRDETGCETIPRRGGMKKIFQALKDNCVVTLAIDQNMTREEGVFVDFFGVPACTTSSPTIIAARTGAALVPLEIWRSDDNRHHNIKFHPEIALPASTGDKAEDIRSMTQRLNGVLEDFVRSHPAQWMWIHKRWKTRPADEEPPRMTY